MFLLVPNPALFIYPPIRSWVFSASQVLFIVYWPFACNITHWNVQNSKDAAKLSFPLQLRSLRKSLKGLFHKIKKVSFWMGRTQ